MISYIWELLVKNGEHKPYFMLDPPSPVHIVETFRSSLQLPVNRVAMLGKGKGFPYPTMFLQPINIQGMTLGTRAWLVLKDVNKANTKKCHDLLEKLTSIFTLQCFGIMLYFFLLFFWFLFYFYFYCLFYLILFDFILFDLILFDLILFYFWLHALYNGCAFSFTFKTIF